jgi:oligopeptide transport system substrate-binding protein
MRTIGKRSFWVGLAGIGWAVWASASQGDAAPLRFRMALDPETLDWNFARSSSETYVIMNLMEGLVEEGSNLKPLPALAESWEITPDGLTYTFKLRRGVKWSDGRGLRAQDFVDSWLRLLSPSSHSDYASFLFDVEGAEDFHAGRSKDAGKVGVVAVGEGTFRVKLRRRVPYFLHIPSFWVTFPIRLDRVKKHGASWASPAKIATLGPYLLKYWKKGRSITLERNDKYFGKAASIDRVEISIEADERKAREAFAAGSLDLLLGATTEDLLQARAGGRVRVEQYPYLATYYLGFDVRRPSVSAAGMRRALASAIDRAAIPAAMQGGEQVASSFVPDGMEGYSPSAYEPMNLFEARGELAKAGHVDGQGMPKLSLWVERMDGAEALAGLITRGLREKLGVVAEAQLATPAEITAAVRAGKVDLFVRHWGADYPEPSSFLDVFRGGSGNNSTGWRNAEYDASLSRAGDVVDEKQRVTAYLEAEHRLVTRESVVVPLFRRRNTVLIGTRVKGFAISPLNYLFLKDVTLR